MFTWQVIQGQAGKTPIVVTACPLTSGMVLAATISTGLTDAALITFTPTFAATGPPNILLTLSASQTASLEPGGYVVHVKLASNNGELAFGLLEVVAAPGSQPQYDVLVSAASVLALNPDIAANPAQVAMLPLIIQGVTEKIRRYCNRMFSRREYTQYLYPTLDGEVMLAEMPVHRAIRVSRRPRTAITITADPNHYQVAYVDFSVQDLPLPNPFSSTYTGINLAGASYGVASSTPILFSGLSTLNDLAAAVNAVSGWKAVVDPNGYGRWPVSEIYCDGTSQGALDDGVQLKVFSEDVSTSRLDRLTGLLVTNSVGLGSDFGPRWGPDWMAWGDYGLDESSDAVRVVYDAGFTKIPSVVQTAAIDLVKTMFSRINLDYAVKKESTGYYSYEINDLMNLAIPDPVRQDLALYVSHRA